MKAPDSHENSFPNVVTRLRAQIDTLEDDKKRLQVRLDIANGKAVKYSDFVKYSDQFVV